jgi:hypothetical protein
VWGREEVHAGFWWGNLRDSTHLEDPGVNGRIILKWISKKWDVWACTGLICLRIGTGIGGRLWMRGYIKCREFRDWLRNC